MGSQQAKAGPEGRARRRNQAKSQSQRTLPLMPPGCHEEGYAGGLRLRGGYVEGVPRLAPCVTSRNLRPPA